MGISNWEIKGYMNVFEVLEAMNESPYGVYAVDVDQRIIHWNPAAERILGYKSEDVAGLRCYEVCASVLQNGTAPICVEGCPSLALARQGIRPPVTEVLMRHSSGERKPVSVIPLIVHAGHDEDGTVIIHLFHERMDNARAEEVAESVRSLIVSDDDFHPPTPSELRVLRMVASSMEDAEIADRLGVTLHTVHAHIRNVRKKLKAKDRLEAVMVAQRRGLL